MRKLLLILGIATLIASPVFAQSVKDKLLALTEGMNDPNPIIRIAALDEALADSSSTVRNYAMTQALASEDADLKSMALTKFFETRKQLIVLVKKSEGLIAKEASITDEEALAALHKKEGYSYAVLLNYTPSILYLIKSFNPNSGEIKGFCMKNETGANTSSVFTGSIVGDKITIEHHCNNVGYDVRACSLQMQLSAEAKYVGTMRCTGETYPAVVELPLK